MKLWTKVILAVSVSWAIAMTIYAQMQVKEASKLGFELGVLDERLKVVKEAADRQAELAAMNAARADVEVNNAREQAMHAQELSLELEKCKSKR